MFRLHRARFDATGRASALESHRPMVHRACEALFRHQGGARLWVIDVDGNVVAAQLFLQHGSRVCAWNGGFDPDWEATSPGLVLYDEGIRDAFDLGAQFVDWGVGNQPHKRHVADTDAPINYITLIVRDARYPLTRMSRAASDARAAATALAHRVPPDLHQWIKRRVPPAWRS
jgi:CelD/BcsL family acetyltransferase involved in cellulose biosynthesis